MSASSTFSGAFFAAVFLAAAFLVPAAFFFAAVFFLAGAFFLAAFFLDGPASRRICSSYDARSSVIVSTSSPLRSEALVSPSVT